MKSLIYVLPIVLAAAGLCQATAPVKQPTPKAAARAEQLKAAVKSFRLQLEYHGEQGKPYYKLTLSVGGIAHDGDIAFDPKVPITEEQAQKIIDCLATGGFLDRADERKPGDVKKHPAPTMPGYTMKVDAGQVVFYDDLGWGLPMLQRLGSLRKVLDGDAATQMDFLLGRLEGHRKEWEKAVTKRAGLAVEKK